MIAGWICCRWSWSVVFTRGPLKLCRLQVLSGGRVGAAGADPLTPAVILKTDGFAHIWCFVMINNNILWFSWFALNRAGFIGSRSQPEGCDYRKVHPNLLHFCLDCLHLVLISEVMSRPWNSWRPSVALILLENELETCFIKWKTLKFI